MHTKRTINYCKCIKIFCHNSYIDVYNNYNHWNEFYNQGDGKDETWKI